MVSAMGMLRLRPNNSNVYERAPRKSMRVVPKSSVSQAFTLPYCGARIVRHRNVAAISGTT